MRVLDVYVVLCNLYNQKIYKRIIDPACDPPLNTLAPHAILAPFPRHACDFLPALFPGAHDLLLKSRRSCPSTDPIMYKGNCHARPLCCPCPALSPQSTADGSPRRRRTAEVRAHAIVLPHLSLNSARNGAALTHPRLLGTSRHRRICAPRYCRGREERGHADTASLACSIAETTHSAALRSPPLLLPVGLMVEQSPRWHLCSG